MEKLLLPPDADGYSIGENSLALASADLSGGFPRTRYDEIGGTRVITLQWSGSPKRYKTVLDFFKKNVGLNCPQFLLDLIIDTKDFKEYVCGVIPNTIVRKTPAGLAWSISASIEVEPRDDSIDKWPELTDGFDPVDVGPYQTISPDTYATSTLVPDGSGYGGHARTINGRSDKRYIEFVITNAAIQDGTIIGVGHLDQAQGSPVGLLNPFDLDSDSLGYYTGPGATTFPLPAIFRFGDIVYTPTANLAVGVTGAIAADIANGKYWFAINNVWQNGVPGVSGGTDGPTGVVYAMVSANDANTVYGVSKPSVAAIGNFRSSQVIYKPPVGFIPWDEAPLILKYPPEQATYSLADANNRISSSEGLASRFRRNLINANNVVNATWVANEATYNYLTQCYRAFVKSGGTTFFISLLLDDPKTMTLYEAMFISGSFRLESQSYEYYSVAAQLIVKPAKYDVLHESWVSDDGLKHIVMPAAFGSYAVTGRAADLRPSARHVPMDTGHYSFTGQSAILSKRLAANALEHGEYLLTGQPAGLGKGFPIHVAHGSYSLTGQSVNLTKVIPHGFSPTDHAPYGTISPDGLSTSTLVPDGSGDGGHARTIIGRTDKRYIEFLITHNAVQGNAIFGVGRITQPQGTPVGLVDPNESIGYLNNGPQVIYNGNNVPGTWGAFTVGDVVAIAADIANSKYWFAINNVWQNSGVPGVSGDVSGPTGTIYGMISANDANTVYGIAKPGVAATGHFISSEFTYTPPSGFTGWGD